MSIEIIEKPTHKCEACGCVFSFGKEDFQEIDTRMNCKEVSLGHSRETYQRQTFVMCPICDTAFVVKERKVHKDKWT